MNMSDKFVRHDVVMHKSGTEYVIILGPQDGVRLESSSEYAYMYQGFWESQGTEFWVRGKSEMEDGRFTISGRPSGAAFGQLCLTRSRDDE